MLRLHRGDKILKKRCEKFKEQKVGYEMEGRHNEKNNSF